MITLFTIEMFILFYETRVRKKCFSCFKNFIKLFSQLLKFIQKKFIELLAGKRKSISYFKNQSFCVHKIISKIQKKITIAYK
jgi:hypothetical protein